VTVALIDSGISERHSALRRRVIATMDFTGGDGVDRYGHGTHVAAIIAGQAGRTVETRELQGVAPGAYLVNLRVLGDDGSGVISSVIEAIDWAIEHQAQYRIAIINLSLGAPVLQPYRDDPMCEAVERAVRAGIVVVAAAGNFGRGRNGGAVLGGITTPGNDPYVITVGAIDTQGTPERSDDVAAAFSSRGPTLYDLVSKPDVMAPGTRIVSAEAAGSVAARGHPERHVTGAGTNGYIQFSGTSMAAGVVSGAVALLLQNDPQLTPEEVKAVIQLTTSVVSSTGRLNGGAGSLNVLAAITFVASGYAELPATTIADERIAAIGVIMPDPAFELSAAALAAGSAGASSIVWDDDIGGAAASD
jgi:serine protease AprX